MENKLKELIEYLKEKYQECVKFETDLDGKSWGWEEGVIISANEADLVIKYFEENESKAKKQR